MEIGALKTRSVFERYAIVFNPDVDEATLKFA